MDYSIFFFQRMNQVNPVRSRDKTITNQKPIFCPIYGTATFMPQKLEIMVGMDIKIVMEARNFMT